MDVLLGGEENIIFSNLTTGASNNSEIQNDAKKDASVFPKYKITCQTQNIHCIGSQQFQETNLIRNRIKPDDSSQWLSVFY